MQVYKYFNIGTDKPSIDIMKKIPHHLLSYIEPDEDYHVKNFINDADKKIKEITERGKIPLLVGGTGLYIKCLLFGIIDESPNEKVFREKFKRLNIDYLNTKLKSVDFESFLKIDKNDKYRIVRALSYYYANGITISEMRKKHCFSSKRFEYLKMAINFNRESLYEKINNRFDTMLEKGLIEETKELINRGFSDTRPMKGIGYREIKDYIEGKLSKEEAVEAAKRSSRKYAKRQITWFKRENDINWINLNDMDLICKQVEHFFKR